jgi:hypothetical protein
MPSESSTTTAGAHVEHQEPVDVADQSVVVEVTGEQFGVSGGEAAVAADVQVPALLSGDHAEVLGAGFGALPRAPGDAGLDLVR